MLYAIICTDKKDHLQLRLDNRPAHLEFLKSMGKTLKIAGPFLDENNKPNGSILLIDVETQQQAEHIAASDPYAIAGLFEKTEIRGWNLVINHLETV